MTTPAFLLPALFVIASTLSDDSSRIIVAPHDQVVVSGGVASFVCTATGNPKPQIEWRKNGKRVTTQRYTVQDMPDGSVLRIEPVRVGRDDAEYECVAENGIGEPVRAQANLQVIEEDEVPDGFPHFTLQPSIQGIEKGRSTTLVCKAEGNPEPSVIWLKDTIPVDMNNPRFTLEHGSSLHITDTEEEDQGNYECVAENSKGTAVSPLATLFVRVRRVPPYFSIPPENLYEVTPGSNPNMTCVAAGSPLPLVKWRKGSLDLSPEDALPVGKNTIFLKNVRESANYTCVASSPLGSIDATAQVVVQAMPRPPTNVQISDVTATSVRLSWSYDAGSENIMYYIIQYKPKYVNQEYSEISGINTLFYTIRNLQPYTEYEFYVIANNAIGRGSPSNPAVVVTGETEPGSSPRNVQARPLSSSTVVIQWDPPKDPNGQVTGYKVFYTTRPNLPTNAWNAQQVDNGKLTTISDLTPHTIYTIRVQAHTSRGHGPLSAPVQVKTQQGVPSQPANMKAVATSSTSIQLSWSKPSHAGESIVGYELYWNDTFTQQNYQRAIPDVESYKLEDLYPDTLYNVWVAAKSRLGEGATTHPLAVKTEQYVPAAPPQDVHGNAVDSRSLSISWTPPPRDKQNGAISYYKIKYLKAQVEADATMANEIEVSPDTRQYTITGLEKFSDYRIWVLAGTVVGDGPMSPPMVIRTDEDVPGEPRNIKVMVLNSTSVNVRWKPPSNRDRNGLIRGYQIHVQETNKDAFVEPLRYDVANEDAEEFNVTGLQPDTEYSVQVAAVTRKGDGARSRLKTIRTQGGVPTRPILKVDVMHDDPQLTVLIQWSRPTHTYGTLLKYRLRYGRVDTGMKIEKELNPLEDRITIENLDRGTKYEFRLAGENSLGVGQEAVEFRTMPEGIPTAPPHNVSHRLQSPTTAVLTWESPLAQYRNGHILTYEYQFEKSSDKFPRSHNTTHNRLVFSNLYESTEYVFRIRAFTSKGAGPWSSPSSILTPGDVPPAPSNVQAMATSETSVEVWWDEVHYFVDILGYQVLYAQTAVEDLDQWKSKKVPMTWSAEIEGLESHVMYAIRVAAFTSNGLGKLSELITVRVTPTDVPVHLVAPEVTTHTMLLTWKPPPKLEPAKYNISYGAHKEFHDYEGALQVLTIPTKSVLVERNVSDYTIKSLMPFTSYQVNITAVPADGSVRPAAKITVTTAMAAPKPMVKPDAGEITDDYINVALPQASEEFGPISHYYLVVVPEHLANSDPNEFPIEKLVTKPEDASEAYIAAKFTRQSIQNTFTLGDGKKYHNYLNRRLQRGAKYRIFVRAVVDAPQTSLYTSSPFSKILSLDAGLRKPSLSGVRPKDRHDSPDVAQIDGTHPNVLWIIGPVAVILLMSVCMVVLLLIHRRRRSCKSPATDTTTKLLLSPADRDLTIHPSDPVEMRRLNYQTPAMISHPPIPVTELANHIERLKANDNLLFSQEYESIEPGQQFTWENSNLEINKSKNRYANVIAYDHSRVVLQPLEGIPGSDYINANYSDGYRKQNAYIASQGPLPETFGDFWRMVWEQRTSTIVMMTKLEERTRIKCDQYWPTRGTEVYGLIHVTLLEVQELATYCIRTFQLQRSSFLEKREVKQFQFTAWPDHGVPDHSTPFLMLLRRIRSINPPDAGPMIIHCSAGVGRSGCFIVIDSMLERLKHENTVDIYGHVTCLRAQRNYMVQTEDQYIFIHDAVLEAVIAGVTEVPACSLYAHIQNLVHVVPGENCSGMELEFKKLCSMRMQPSKFVSANLPVNKYKNRLMNILPYESSRVCLQPIRGVDGSDYINASFLDGYRYRNAYIATQGPLPETTDDFWRMLWEHNSNIVVMLTRQKEMGRDKCHQYWPSERSQRYLYYVVDPITEYNMPQYILREFKVTDARDGQSRTIRQFEFDWPEQSVPKSGEGFIEFIGQVHKTKEQFGQEGPITVHCSAGVGRTGVFVTLSIVLERMQYEGVVDMFQTVRTLRTQRPGMVQTEEQYHFCYKAALEYLGNFDHYAH